MTFNPANIPTSITEAEALGLRSLAQGKVVLEIGSLFGASTITMASVANVVWAVDPHEGYPRADSPSTLSQFMKNIEDSGLRHKIVPILTTGARMLDSLSRAYDIFGFVFIDTMGDYEGTLQLLFAIGIIHPGPIAVHDYGHADWPGVTRAVDYYRSLYEGYPFHLVDTLAVLEGL